MHIEIDIPHRYACMRAHTATHLLHAELTKIFPQTKQAGSYVGPDELRFDFFAERGLTSEELHNITTMLNDAISNNIAVSVREMSYEDALQTGAKAFFEDTYPEVVRVVSIALSSGGGTTKEPVQKKDSGNIDGLDSSFHSEGSILSIELCGGTHVTETSQIGSFVIIEQTAVAAGVKRIVALTGPKVAAHAQRVQSELDAIAHKVSVPVKQLDAKIDKILVEADEMKQKIVQLSAGVIQSLSRTPGTISTYQCDGLFDYDKDIAPLGFAFADAVTQIKGIAGERSWLVWSQTGQYAFAHPQAKKITQELGLKGGGSDSFVQGRDEGIIKILSY